MLKTVERLNLILTMNKYSLDFGLLKDHSADVLIGFCAGLETRQTPTAWYAGCPAIQKELISDDRFFFYLEKMSKIGLAMRDIDSHLKELHSKGETALTFPIDCLLSGLALTNCRIKVFYDYMKHFSGMTTNKAEKEAILDNLAEYQKELPKPISELSSMEKRCFTEPCLANSRLIPDDIGVVLAMLAAQARLLDIIRYLHDNEFRCSKLSFDHYASLSLAPKDIYMMLRRLHRLLGYDNMADFLNRWIENNCTLYDLEVLFVKLNGMAAEQIEEVLYTRSSYINLIYGGKISKISLSDVLRTKEDILIYAITTKKNGFIRLVEGNFEIFQSLPSDSILFRREFYTRLVNINALNANNLRDCKRMSAGDSAVNYLILGRVYTFDEIKALYQQPVQYGKLYARLNISRVDSRLIVLRQLTRQNLLADTTEDEHIASLAEKLSQKPLSAWREQDFAHIEGLGPKDSVELLLCYTEAKKLIPQMKTRIDAKLAVRNRSSVHSYETIADMKGGLIEIDSAWKLLSRKMDFSDQFLESNQERIIEFLCNNGADIAYTYCAGQWDGDTQCESMRRILKALLTGEFKKLKYYADDLRLEIDYAISHTQKSVWMVNLKLTSKNITVSEHDDFFSTMLLGITPYRTCLSYIDGQYRECLLSNFDSNKKVLYARLNGKIVGRALIRLTKGRFKGNERKKDSGVSASLSFVDVDATSDSSDESGIDETKERLVLFLEHSYSAHITEDTHRQIKRQFIELMEEKAAALGAMLVLSNAYADSLRPGYTRTLFHIYISRSKAGKQYLDSLNGSASVSDEGGYRANNFYIRNGDVMEKALL